MFHSLDKRPALYLIYRSCSLSAQHREHFQLDNTCKKRVLRGFGGFLLHLTWTLLIRLWMELAGSASQMPFSCFTSVEGISGPGTLKKTSFCLLLYSPPPKNGTIFSVVTNPRKPFLHFRSVMNSKTLKLLLIYNIVSQHLTDLSVLVLKTLNDWGVSVFSIFPSIFLQGFEFQCFALRSLSHFLLTKKTKQTKKLFLLTLYWGQVRTPAGPAHTCTLFLLSTGSLETIKGATCSSKIPLYCSALMLPLQKWTEVDPLLS